MRLLLFSIISFMLSSCVGTRGIHGTYINTFDLPAQSTGQLIVRSTKSYIFDLTNTSSTNSTILIKGIDRDEIKLATGQVFRVENEPLNGIKIQNLSNKTGKFRLNVYLKGEMINDPILEIIK